MSGSKNEYFDRIIKLFGSSIIQYLPLSDTSGVTALDISGNTRNGTYRNTTGTLNGVTLNQTGIGDRKTSIALDGVAGFVNIYSAGLASAINFAEGTWIIWLKIDDIDTWTDGSVNYGYMIFIDANNFLYIVKPANNTISFTYKAGGTTSALSTLEYTNRTGWLPFVFTWSVSNDRVRAFGEGGVQIGTNQTSIGTWSGVLPVNGTTIGSQTSNLPTNFWDGLVAHSIILNREATEAEIISATSYKKSSISDVFLGGSITLGMSATHYTTANYTNLSYFRLTAQWLYNQYPDYIWTHNNAGIGSTGSWYGLVRLQADVIDKTPSVVVVEYAVNDSTSDFNKACEESLFRRIRNTLPNAKIIVAISLGVIDSAVNDATATNELTRQNLLALASHYGLVVVDYVAAVQALVTAETNVVQDFFAIGETVHPNDFGHALYASLMQTELTSLANIATFPLPDRLYATNGDYENTPIIRTGIDNDGETGTGWGTDGTIRQSSTAGDTITYTGTLNSFGLDQSNGSGVWQYSVDGGAFSTNKTGSYLNSAYSGERGSHTIVIKVISGTVKISRFLAI